MSKLESKLESKLCFVLFCSKAHALDLNEAQEGGDGGTSVTESTMILWLSANSSR